MKEIRIIPRPTKIARSDGAFEIQSTTTIYVSDDAPQVGQALCELLRPTTGYDLPLRTEPAGDTGPNESIRVNSHIVIHPPRDN